MSCVDCGPRCPLHGNAWKQTSMNTAENRHFWGQRASLGEKAGTQDLILKDLERVAIGMALKRVPGSGDYPFDILEVGCGLGETASSLAADEWRWTILGIDSSPAMIQQAHARSNNVRFVEGDAMWPPAGPFDAVYSQRCLINLPSWDAQKQAIDAIAGVLVSGGRFLMCEHSQDGLDAINQIRQSWKRPLIERPWHNLYFRDSDLVTVSSLRLIECVPFSATYYFLSRILNDKLAEAEGKVPDYNARINQLAFRLPADCVDPRFAQGRLWIWEKV